MHSYACFRSLLMLVCTTGKMKTLDVKDRDTSKVSTVQAHMFVNAAGLYAQQLAKKLQDLPGETIPKSFLARGHYCTMEGSSATACVAGTVINQSSINPGGRRSHNSIAC